MGSVPHCSARLESKGSSPGRLLTLLGWIRWRRKVGRSRTAVRSDTSCRWMSPSHCAVAETTCESVQKVGCQLGVCSLQDSGPLLKQLTGSRSAATASGRGCRPGAASAAERRAGTAGGAARHLPAEEPRTARYRCCVGLGGRRVAGTAACPAGAPDGQVDWREAKVGLVVRLDERENEERQEGHVLRQRRVVAVRGDVAKLESRFRLEAIRQGLLAARGHRVASDGGVWLWKLLERLREPCPAIVAVLDFYHAAQNL